MLFSHQSEELLSCSFSLSRGLGKRSVTYNGSEFQVRNSIRYNRKMFPNLKAINQLNRWTYSITKFWDSLGSGVIGSIKRSGSYSSKD